MKDSQKSKSKLHPRNKHNSLYDFEILKNCVPELEIFIVKNPSGKNTIDFSNPKAVLLLNKALLLSTYKLSFWELPNDNLCPPIPGRADYIHYIADLLSENNDINQSKNPLIKILDVGVGANCIYPIIGTTEYNWQFVGSDVSEDSLKNVQKIVSNNTSLKDKIELRLQPNAENILKNIVHYNEKFDVVICNPPFFKSKEEAFKQTFRKLKNLNTKTPTKITHNFGGQSNELWYTGGELRFLTNYINESTLFKNQIGWFTSLVSNEKNISPLKKILRKINASDLRIIEMQQGNKVSRILAWRF